MGLFNKPLPDPDWYRQSGPILEAAGAARAALSGALRSEFLEERRLALVDGAARFSALLDAMDGIASPTSAEARAVAKQVRGALAALVEGCRHGGFVLERAATDISRLQRKGLRGRPRPGRIFGLLSDDPDAWEVQLEQAEERLGVAVPWAAAGEPVMAPGGGGRSADPSESVSPVQNGTSGRPTGSPRRPSRAWRGFSVPRGGGWSAGTLPPASEPR